MARKKKASDSEENAIKNLEKFIAKGGRERQDCIPTGHFTLDFVLNYGVMPPSKNFDEVPKYDPKKRIGIPRGKLVEIFGDSGGGKSSLAYRIAGSAQKLGLEVLWADAENSFSEDLAEINAVNLDTINKMPGIFSAEETLDNLYQAMYHIENLGVVVLDSIAALVPATTQEGSSEDQTMALKARLLSEQLPKLAQAAYENGILFILINQSRQKIGLSFGDASYSPGGNAKDFMTSIRILVTKRTSKENAIFIENPKAPGKNLFIGRYSGIKLFKNRFAKPLVDANGKDMVISIPIYYEQYFPNVLDVLFEKARQLQVVKIRKGVYIYDKIRADTKQDFFRQLHDNNMIKVMADQLTEVAEEKKEPLPPELINFDMKNIKIKRVNAPEKEVEEALGDSELTEEEQVSEAENQFE